MEKISIQDLPIFPIFDKNGPYASSSLEIDPMHPMDPQLTPGITTCIV